MATMSHSLTLDATEQDHRAVGFTKPDVRRIPDFKFIIYTVQRTTHMSQHLLSHRSHALYTMNLKSLIALSSVITCAVAQHLSITSPGPDTVFFSGAGGVILVELQEPVRQLYSPSFVTASSASAAPRADPFTPTGIPDRFCTSLRRHSCLAVLLGRPR